MRYALPMALLVLLVIALAIDVSYSATASPLPSSFTANGRTYNISAYAVTAQEQQHGLMNATVTNTTFMLFIFPNSSIYPFWMKDTYAPLDIIWVEAVNKSGRIVYAVNATPCVNYDNNQTNCLVYTPRSDANYVIETRAGFMQRNNLSIGSSITFNET